MSSSHKINIDLYPAKWAEFTKNFDEEIAKEKYYSFCRTFCLEKYQLKYGVEEGTQHYNQKKESIDRGVSLEKFKKKYGDEEGEKKFYQWKKSVSGSLETFINRFGLELGHKKYNEFRKKCSNAVLNAKSIKGSTYNTRQIPTSFEYFLKKANNDPSLARRLQSDRQRTSNLESYIKRYGEEEGKEKYQEANLKKRITLENMIRVHGEILGIEKYEKWKQQCGKSGTIEFLTKKHGYEIGLQVYAEINSKKAITLENMIRVHGEILGIEKYEKWKKGILCNISYSKSGTLFCKELHFLLENKLIGENPYYGSEEFCIYNKEKKRHYFPDFFIKSQNIIVEYMGDYWHRNPKIYSGPEAEKIWEKDRQRLEDLTHAGYSVLNVFEFDIVHSYGDTINALLNEINKLWKI